MARNDAIQQKIELTGEKEYRAALKAANNELKALRSALKAETAELGTNATAQQKNEVKAKNLRKQIAEQEKVVSQLQTLLGEVNEKYADNRELITKWETSLNNARAKLAEMNNQLTAAQGGLDATAQGMREVAGSAAEGVVASQSFADAISGIADAASAVSDGIETIFTGMVATIRGAVTELWADMTELAGRANAWSDLAGYWNTSAGNIQKWSHAVAASHNDFNTLTSAVSRISMGDQQKIAELTGVSGAMYSDQWEYAMAVLDSLGGMDYDRRLNALGDIFGERRATGVMDLLNDWGKITGLLGEFDAENGGLGMTEGELSTMSQLAEDVDHIEETWKAFKDSFLAGAFGQLSLDLTGSAKGILDALIGFMDADSQEERDQAIADLETNMTDFFTRLGEAISAAAESMGAVGDELQGSENGVVQAIGTVLKTLSDLLKWFADEGNIQHVIHGMEVLAGFWIAGKGASMALKIAEMVANLKTIKGFGAMSSLAGAGGGSAAAGGVASATGAIGQLVGVLMKMTPILAGIAVLLTPSGGDAEWSDLVHDDGTPTEAGKAAMAAEGSTPGYIPGISDAVRAMNTVSPDQWAAAQGYWDLFRSRSMTNEDYTALKDAFAGQDGLFQDLIRMMAELDADEATRGLEDLPVSWYEEHGGNAADLSGLPGLIQSAVRTGAADGVSNIVVTLDGAAVGRLVAPYVSQRIAGAVGMF